MHVIAEAQVPTYSYSCVVCGGFDVVRPMAEAGRSADCPGCGRSGRRIYGAPALRSLQPGLRRALDAQHRSSDAPQVVRSVPTAGRRRVQRQVTDPRQARLPRP